MIKNNKSTDVSFWGAIVSQYISCLAHVQEVIFENSDHET
jgi:hypothetical protein